jgi:hypothetical protein
LSQGNFGLDDEELDQAFELCVKAANDFGGRVHRGRYRPGEPFPLPASCIHRIHTSEKYDRIAGKIGFQRFME